jgi:hypothetical protein
MLLVSAAIIMLALPSKIAGVSLLRVTFGTLEVLSGSSVQRVLVRVFRGGSAKGEGIIR